MCMIQRISVQEFPGTNQIAECCVCILKKYSQTASTCKIHEVAKHCAGWLKDEYSHVLYSAVTRFGFTEVKDKQKKTVVPFAS